MEKKEFVGLTWKPIKALSPNNTMTSCSIYNSSLVYKHESGHIILSNQKIEYTYPIIFLSYLDDSHLLICDSNNKVVCYALCNPYAIWEILLDEAPLSIAIHTDSYFINSQTSIYSFEIDGGYSKVFKIPAEDLHIVQVYPIPNKRCVVSTYKRTYYIEEGKHTPIGSRERRGDYGACYIKDTLYCARPNNYLWKARITGEVLTTLQFKLTSAKVNFGMLYEWEGLLVSYDGNDIIFIDLDTQKIISIDHITCKLFYNHITQELYRIKDNQIQLAASLSLTEKLQDLIDSEQYGEAVIMVMSNSELQKLELLSDLCYKIFIQKVKLDQKLQDEFADLISKLESGETIALNFTLPTTEEIIDYFDNRLKDKQNEKLRKKQALYRKQQATKQRKSEKIYVYSWIKDCGFTSLKEAISELELNKLLEISSKYVHSKEVTLITKRIILARHSYCAMIRKNEGMWLIQCIYEAIKLLEEFKLIARLGYDSGMIRLLNQDIDKLNYNATHLI